MKILLTNILMAERSGTEVATKELAYELRRRGHEIAIYAHRCGKLADTLRSQGLAVIDKINQVPFVPDIIHGHHNVTLAIALAHFPKVPSIFVCHDFDAWHDRAFIHPNIQKYIAVDQLCLQRLTIDGIPNKKCRIINNAVVISRFIQKEEISDSPKKALLLSKGATHTALVKAVCEELDIELDLIGPAFNKTIDNLHEILKDYDLVFATARMALEALACGCGVIVCDHRGFAGAVTPENWMRWYAWNLGRGLLLEETSKERLFNAVTAYSSAEIAKLTKQVRKDADIKHAVDQYELIYKEAILSFYEEPAVDTIDTNFNQFTLAAFLEDFLPSYNPNTTGFSIPRKIVGVETEELRLLNDINSTLNHLQHELKELPVLQEINAKIDQLQHDSNQWHVLQDVDANLQIIHTQLGQLQNDQLQNVSENLKVLQKMRVKLNRLQRGFQKLNLLPEMETTIKQLQQDAESIRRDIGVVGIMTKLLRMPYSQIKKMVRSISRSKFD